MVFGFKLKNSSFSKNKKPTEQGFTLMELIVVIVVLSILASISLTIFFNQQRAAAVASVQSDVRNSVKELINSGQILTLKKESDFLSNATLTGENKMGANIEQTPGNPSACIWGYHKFSPTDAYVYHYSSTTSKFIEGPCPGDTIEDLIREDGNTSPESKPNPSEPNTTLPGSGGGTPTTGIDDENLKPYTKGDVTYTPRYQYNSFGSNSATIYIDITSKSSQLVEWEYQANMSKAPYWNSTSAEISYNDGQGNISFDDKKLLVHSKNINNGVSSSRSITITYNLTKFTPPDILELYKVSVTPASSNSIWWACIEVRVTSDSVTPITWSETIDLKNEFKSLQGKNPQFTNLKAESKGDLVYKITGNTTNSDTVSKNHPVWNSQTICYGPEGKPW